MSDLIARGRLLRQQGRHSDAEACLRQAIAAEPDDALAFTELAQCLLEQDGRRTEALGAIDRAISLEPGYSHLHALRSQILSRLDRDREALDAADAAIAMDPDQGWYFAVKAGALAGLERYAEAEAACRQALALDADDDLAANLLAHLLRIQGKTAESRLAADRLLADEPESPYAHFNAGWTALQGGDHRRAESHFREALRLDAGFEPARDGLLESFRARSPLYRAYLWWNFQMQRFSTRAQWAILIGFVLAVNFGRRLLELLHPLAGTALITVYACLVLWSWLAPGLGNLLIAADSQARHALRPEERRLGFVAGGGFILGLLLVVVSLMLDFLPGLLIGGALALGAVPARLFIGNESPRGRVLFGCILAFVYLVGLGTAIGEAFRGESAALSGRTDQLITAAVIAVAACTWLGSVPALVRERPR